MMVLRGLQYITGLTAGLVAGYFLLSTWHPGLLLAWLTTFVATYSITHFYYHSPPGRVGMGLLAGLNLGANLIAWLSLGTPIAIPGSALAILSALSVLPGIGAGRRYQLLIGRANWLLPMSWPINIVGLVFAMASLGGHLLAGRVHPIFRIYAVKWHRTTGMLAIRGGWIANLNTYRTAFNMGNLTFVHGNSLARASGVPLWHLDHEAGHTLNLASFGLIFHLTGFLHEVAFGGGNLALAELLAESNVPQTSKPHLPLWCR